MAAGPTECDVDAERPGRRGLRQRAAVGGRGVLRVGHLDVVGLVTRHHLVARDAIRHRVHDRPLRRGGIEAAPGFGCGQRHDLRAADVHPETLVPPVAVDPDAAPDDLARPAHARQRAASEPEVHGRLPEALGPTPAADEVGGGRAAGNLEDPDPLVGGARLIPVSPADVVQGVLGGLAEFLVHALRDQAVEARALVDFVEVHEWAALEEHAAGPGGGDGRAPRVVEHSLDEVARRQQVLEPLLVLDADAVAAEAVGDAQCRDIHPALQEHLLPCQVASLVAAEVEPHARLLEPAKDRSRLALGDLHGLVVERALAESLLEDARRVEEAVGNDRVEHPHAALVEHAHERLATAQVGGEFHAHLLQRLRDAHRGDRHDVTRVVTHRPVREPRPQVAVERGAAEVVRPERGVGDARLRERSVEVEHPHEARPLSRPVGDGEDRTGVGREPGQHVVGVLPDRFRDDERRGRIDRLEDAQALPGARDEPMAARPAGGMSSHQRPSRTPEGRGQVGLHRLLGRPADPIRLLAKIATGDQDGGVAALAGGRGTGARGRKGSGHRVQHPVTGKPGCRYSWNHPDGHHYTPRVKRHPEQRLVGGVRHGPMIRATSFWEFAPCHACRA